MTAPRFHPTARAPRTVEEIAAGLRANVLEREEEFSAGIIRLAQAAVNAASKLRHV